MPQKAWNEKRERQYEHIKESLEERGKSEESSEEIAARTVDEARARAGESKTASRSSLDDVSSPRRGGLRSHTGPGGRTYRQLYNEAKEAGIEGRWTMNKAQLGRARSRVAEPRILRLGRVSRPVRRWIARRERLVERLVDEFPLFVRRTRHGRRICHLSGVALDRGDRFIRRATLHGQRILIRLERRGPTIVCPHEYVSIWRLSASCEPSASAFASRSNETSTSVPSPHVGHRPSVFSVVTTTIVPPEQRSEACDRVGPREMARVRRPRRAP